MVTHNDAIKNKADRVVKLHDGMIRENYLNEKRFPYRVGLVRGNCYEKPT